MFDVRIILVYVDATSNVTSEVDIDLEKLILDIIHLKWSDLIGQIHLSCDKIILTEFIHWGILK